MKMSHYSKKHENGHHPNSRPKDTKGHPWRKRNDSLPDYTKKGWNDRKLTREKGTEG